MIKYLIDEHLSPEIAIQGRNKSIDVVHVNEVELNDTADSIIWQYCLDNGYCMVSADVLFRAYVEKMIAENKDCEGFFAVERHLRYKSGIGTILESLVFYHEALRHGAADYEIDIRNHILWIK